MNLEEIRRDIDEVDRGIVELFVKRMELVKKVAQYKRENNMPVYRPEREKALLEKVGELAGAEYSAAAQSLFNSIMDISKINQQERLSRESELTRAIARGCAAPEPIPEGVKVACQGIAGANSHTAAAMLTKSPQRIYYQSFDEVFKAVAGGECEYGVLPMENTSAGTVTQVYDLMQKNGFYIVKACALPINHCLMAPEGASLEDIQEVYSHPQAISQCSNFFAENKTVVAHMYSNTAAAARLVADMEDKYCAAIASADCAELYGLNILQRNIQNEKNNYTSFMLIGAKPKITPEANKISLVLKLPHRAGSLYKVISRFALKGLNLTKIESRPIPQAPFEFLFYFDFNGNVRQQGVTELLQTLDQELEYFRFLGNYHDDGIV